jgi:8-oxo-dGTP pyrophosphatase MutT (NUDIX family)
MAWPVSDRERARQRERERDRAAYLSNIICANCSNPGHVHRNCPHPAISYGIIAYRWVGPTPADLRYLFVQRHDSMCFVEFLRGKYELDNVDYICKLLSNMTETERRRLTDIHDFAELWFMLWGHQGHQQAKSPTEGGGHHPPSRNREYNDASWKHRRLWQGYRLPSARPGEPQQSVDLRSLIASTTTTKKEAEWGLPKGRRALNESNLECAIREFFEETSLKARDVLDIREDSPTLSELYMGTNHKFYQHVYYTARFIGDDDSERLQSATPNEIQDVRWFSYQEAMDHISDHNVDRKKLMTELHERLSRPAPIKRCCCFQQGSSQQQQSSPSSSSVPTSSSSSSSSSSSKTSSSSFSSTSGKVSSSQPLADVHVSAAGNAKTATTGSSPDDSSGFVGG